MLFSVIIPAYNNADGLRACLDALKQQTLSAEQFEVVVVDDGSEPPLVPGVQCIRVRNGGPATARNHGARAAKGRYLAFTDHDCLPSPEWLAALRDGFSVHPECLLGGPKENGLAANVYSTAHQASCDYVEHWFRGAAGFFTSNNLAVPRQAFLQIGGFNGSFAFAHEDREFGARWSDQGRCSAWIADAVVVHRHELTLWTFLRQHFRYGLGAMDFRMARREAKVRPGVRFEGPRFHFGLVTAPFASHNIARSVQLAVLLVWAQAAYVAGVVARGRRTTVAVP